MAIWAAEATNDRTLVAEAPRQRNRGPTCCRSGGSGDYARIVVPGERRAAGRIIGPTHDRLRAPCPTSSSRYAGRRTQDTQGQGLLRLRQQVAQQVACYSLASVMSKPVLAICTGPLSDCRWRLIPIVAHNPSSMPNRQAAIAALPSI